MTKAMTLSFNVGSSNNFLRLDDRIDLSKYQSRPQP